MNEILRALGSPALQYGALGLAFVLALALARAFAVLIAYRERMQERLFEHHCERERALCEQFVACIDRNSAALEKVESGLQRLQVQIARQEGGAEAAMCHYE